MATALLQPAKSGTEILANTVTADRQEGSAVAPLSDGGYVVTWHAMNQGGDNGWGVFAQRFNADGTANGGEIHVNTTLGNHQAGATAVARPGGGFTVLWTSFQSGTNDIYAQRFDGNGARIGGEFAIAASADLQEQGVNAFSLADGSFVVAWDQVGAAGRQEMAQHFDASANALGSAFAASDVFIPGSGSVVLSQGPAALTALASGNIVSVWTQAEPGDTFTDVWAEILTASGSPAGSAFRVNTTVDGAQGQPAAAGLADGSFVIAYYSGFVGGTVFQRFAADGSRLGGEVRVDNTPNGAVTPTVTAVADGGFVIAWQGGADGDGSAVSAQRFAANGSAIGDNFLLDTQTAAWQSDPALAQLADGTLVASWSSEAYGQATDIALQRFDLPQKLAGNSADNLISGSTVDDTLTGGAGIDTLLGGAGDDRLDGGTGADSMVGGTGDDTYVVDNAGDQVVEQGGEGTDSVRASVSYVLAANIEKLVLLGTAAIDGAGNGLANALSGNAAANLLSGGGGNDSLSGLAGDDTLLGGADDDRLDGGSGADSMAGGAGNDTYVVDAAGDRAVEQAGEGIDIVRASISYELAASIEKLVLLGTAAIDGTGNALANALTGNAAANLLSGGEGNDTISGGAGSDTLIGGAGQDRLAGGDGADVFRFASALEGGDRITGFSTGEDRVGISAAGFGGGLVAGMDLSTGNYFVNGTTATAAHAQFIHAGAGLYWDADGTGAGAKVLIATFAGGAVLTAADVHVIA